MIGKILDLIWPRRCAVCGRPADRPGRHICSDCVNRIPFVELDGVCRVCGRGAVGLSGEFLCTDCRRENPFYDRATSAFTFEGEARELVNSFKFREHFFLEDDFVDFLEARVRAYFCVNEIYCVVPIPSAWWSRWLRGFSPSRILARALAKRLGKPERNLLKRIGRPKRQGGLSEADRRTNVLGTFALRRSGTTDFASSSPVLLVDDVMTTGSTLSEAARVLKSAGVETVWAVSLARSAYV